MNTSQLELVVGRKIVDLNRIPLPADTPIIDERFEDKGGAICRGGQLSRANEIAKTLAWAEIANPCPAQRGDVRIQRCLPPSRGCFCRAVVAAGVAMNSFPTVLVTRKRVARFVAPTFAIPAVIAVSLLIALGQTGVIIPALLGLAIPCGVVWLLLSLAAATAKETASLKWWEIVAMFGILIALPTVAFALPGVFIVPSTVVLVVAVLYFFSRPRVQGRLEQLRGPSRYEQPDRR